MSVISDVSKSIGEFVQRNAPTILLTVGITGSAIAVVLGVAETPKALEIIKEKEAEKKAPLTKTEKVKACWKVYLPSALVFTGSAGCLIGSQVLNNRKISVLASVAHMSETALLEYKNAVINAIGEEKEKQITQTFEQKMDEKPTWTGKNGQTIIIPSMNDLILCYDQYSDREFVASQQEIEEIDIWVRKQLSDTNEQTVSLHDYYMQYSDNNFIAREGDEEIGWNCRDNFGLVHNRADINKYGQPRLIVSFKEKPHSNYSNWN